LSKQKRKGNGETKCYLGQIVDLTDLRRPLYFGLTTGLLLSAEPPAAAAAAA
jgi:hypothetical protein